MLFASDDNIKDALDIATRHNGEIIFSSMGFPLSKLMDRVLRVKQIGVTNILAHGTGKTTKIAFMDMINRAEIISKATGINLSVGGGIDRTNISLICKFNPSTVIVGRGIFKANNLLLEIEKLKEKFYINE